MPQLRAVPAPEFVGRERPVRATLLYPWLREKSLVLLHAPRGLGKSWLAMTIALAVSGGYDTRPFGWSVSEPSEVVYLDAEMAADELALRMKMLCPEEFLPERLRIISLDETDGPMPSLSTIEGRLAVEDALGAAQFVVMDNVSTLWSGMGDQNAAESWDVAQTWLLGMRRANRTIFLVDHSGKTAGRGARGTSRKEDIMDVCIELTRPENAVEEDGAYFDLHFTKKRGLYGEKVRSRQCRLRVTLPACTWVVSDVGSEDLDECRELMAQGLSVRQIASRMDLTHGTAQRLVRRAKGVPNDAS